MNESIESSNNSIAQSAEYNLISLRNKLSDPGISEKAKHWYPKTERVQNFSKNVFDYIEKIKTDLVKESKTKIDNGSLINIFNGNGLGLYERLLNYRNKRLQADSGLTYEFKNNLGIFTISVDTAKRNQKDLLIDYFKNSAIAASIAMRTKFQNSIGLIEEKMITFCNENMAIGQVIRDLNYSRLLVAQSSTVVQADEQIEITAGIGMFSGTMQPEIFIDNKPIMTNSEGIAIYKLKAASRPGK